MIDLKEKFSDYYYVIRNSIGFYPTIIALMFVALAILFVLIDFTWIGLELKDEFAWLDIKNADTARAILSTLIAGIISLTALSFSMVMIVLNQATTTLSPKVVLGLTSEKSHQIVLGVYLGTVIYCMLVLLTIRNYEQFYIPSLSVQIGILLGILCLILFVYFIHKTSSSIQVNNVIERIHLNTKKQLKKEMKEKSLNDNIEVNNYIEELNIPFNSIKSGYLQEIDVKDLLRIAKDNDLIFKMESELTNYIIENMPLVYTNKKITDEKVKNSIYDQFIFYTGEKIEQNYRYGFTQLMEIAIKALSPGINDPGRAIVCINYLADLFSILYFYKEKNIFKDEDGKIRIILKKLDYNYLFNSCFTPIRQYGGNDISIVRSLLLNIERLSFQDKSAKLHKKLYNDHIIGVLKQITGDMYNHSDISAINDIITNLNKIDGYYNLKKIKFESTEM